METILVLIGLALSGDSIAPCANDTSEADATSCAWVAADRGNGLGESYISVDGHAVYVPDELARWLSS